MNNAMRIFSTIFKLFCLLLLIVAALLFKYKEQIIVYKPIGYFSTKFTEHTGAPRQGLLEPKTKGVIILNNKYTGALKDLDKFEYIWVISHFDRVNGWDSIITPPESDHRFGLFATRSPRRPNAVGLSLMKMDSIVGNKIYVSGVDLFDKTPVLDIKPFLPSVDYVLSIKNMEAEYLLGHHDEDFIDSSMVDEFVFGDKH